MRRGAAALVAVLLLVAGCGGGGGLSKDEYQNEVGTALRPVRSGLGAIRTGKLSSRTEAAAVLAGVAKPMATAAAKIDAIDAPDDVKEAQRMFVAAMRAFAVDSLRGAQTLQRGGTKALRRRGGIISPQTAAQLRAASAAYRAKGYDVGTAVGPAQ